MVGSVYGERHKYTVASRYVVYRVLSVIVRRDAISKVVVMSLTGYESTRTAVRVGFRFWKTIDFYRLKNSVRRRVL